MPSTDDAHADAAPVAGGRCRPPDEVFDMMKRFWIVGGTLVVCGCLLAALSSRAADKPAPAPAADKDKPAAPSDPATEVKSSEEADAVADIATAYKLADWGRRMDPQSPFALCTAAEMLNRTTLLPGADAKDRVTVTAADSGATVKPDVNALKTEASALLDEALKMAKTNKQDLKTVQAMADAVKSGRGGLNGPLMFTMRLRPGQTDTYNIKFKRGEWARVAVHQDGVNAIDLHAADNYGHDRAADWARNPVIQWMVRQGDGSDYKVTVRNARGDDTITYQLFTN